MSLETLKAFEGEYWLSDEEATRTFGANLAQNLGVGDIIYLIGDLGAGKSSLARAIIQALTSEHQEVPSPSFALMHIYEAQKFDKRFEIAHLDLYRLKDPDEVYELGLFELQPRSLTLIEWPDRLGGHGFDQYLQIELKHGFDDKGHQGLKLLLRCIET